MQACGTAVPHRQLSCSSFTDRFSSLSSKVFDVQPIMPHLWYCLPSALRRRLHPAKEHTARPEVAIDEANNDDARLQRYFATMPASKVTLYHQILCVGKRGSGRTSLQRRLILQWLRPPGTYADQTHEDREPLILRKCVIADIEPVYAHISPDAYARSFSFAFFTYNVSDRQGFEEIKSTFNTKTGRYRVTGRKPWAGLMIFALACDVSGCVDSVSAAEGHDLAKQQGVPFHEKSALTGSGCEFEDLQRITRSVLSHQ